jgi:hypothetical protein
VKQKRIARPLLIASAGAIITMGTSMSCGNLLPLRPCPDGGVTQAGNNCPTDDAAKADAGVTNDGGTDGGP